MAKLTKMKINCPVCSKELWLQNLKNHIECVHKKNKTHDCHICKKKFYCKSNLNRHIKEIHLGSKRTKSNYVKEARLVINLSKTNDFKEYPKEYLKILERKINKLSIQLKKIQNK